MLSTASSTTPMQTQSPFTWTKDPNKIIAAVKRGHQVLDSIHQESLLTSLLGRNAACVVRSSARASCRRHRSPETDSEAFSSACRHIWSASLTGAVVFGFQVTKIELWGTSASRAHRADVID